VVRGNHFQLPGLEAVNSRLDGWPGLEESNSIEEDTGAWFDTGTTWDLEAQGVSPQESRNRLWLEPGSSLGKRSLYFSE
jgi:hypothetical protein